jgi:hypothetical protein
MESLQDWVEIERECIRRFKRRATEIRATHPELTDAEAFCRAVKELPETTARYNHARLVLSPNGIPSLPLR